MRTLLIADLHLHPEAPEVTEGFLAYLNTRAAGAEALYILGDLFDAWVGDDILDTDGLDPLAERVAVALKQLSENGTKIYLMHGNRDFLLGKRFAQACGATLLDDPYRVELGGKPVLLMHGDTLCTRDTAYMAFRAQARDPQWQAQILAMPIDARLELAKSLRQQSSEANAGKAEEIMDVTPEEVYNTLLDHGVETLIHGHTHRPAIHVFTLDGQPARRLVLGDWQPHRGWEIRFEAGRPPRLLEFPLASRQ